EAEEEPEVEPTPLPGTTPTPPPISFEATPTPSPVMEAPPPIIPIQAGTTPGSPISRFVTEPGRRGPARAGASGVSRCSSGTYTPLTISLSLFEGFDDNFRTTQSGQASWFTNPAVSILYNLPGTSTQVVADGGASFTYYQGNSSGGSGGGSQRNDINLHGSSLITHSVSERLKLEAKLYATYRAEPDLSSNVGFQSRQGNFFNTQDSLEATYHWSRRFFTVTSDRIQIVDYGNNSVQGGASQQAVASQNRIENTIDQEFKYDLLHHGNSAVLEYRFEITDYQDSSSLNSLTNVALVGFDEEFSPR